MVNATRGKKILNGIKLMTPTRKWIHLEMDEKNLGTFYRDFQAKVPYIQKTSNFVVEVSIVGEDRKDWSKVLRPRKNEGINM